MDIVYIFLALIIGFLIVIATILNGKIAQRIGVANDVLINFFAGLLTSILVLLLFKNSIPSFSEILSIPKYYYLGGIVGLIVICLSNIIVPKIQAAYLVVLAFVGQILTSAVIDYLFFDLLSKGKIVGGIFILIGLLYNFNIDRKDKTKGNEMVEVLQLDNFN